MLVRAASVLLGRWGARRALSEAFVSAVREGAVELVDASLDPVWVCDSLIGRVVACIAGNYRGCGARLYLCRLDGGETVLATAVQRRVSGGARPEIATRVLSPALRAARDATSEMLLRASRRARHTDSGIDSWLEAHLHTLVDSPLEPSCAESVIARILEGYTDSVSVDEALGAPACVTGLVGSAIIRATVANGTVDLTVSVMGDSIPAMVRDASRALEIVRRLAIELKLYTADHSISKATQP